MTDIIAKTREDYNRIAKHFSKTRGKLWEGMEGFKKYVKNGQNILDWGCGHGRLVKIFSDYQIHYFGVDQSSGLLKIAQKMFASEIKKGQAKFFCTEKKSKKFPKEFFDLVFMIASFHHLPNKKSREELLKKTFLEMKPKAKIIIMVWNFASDWSQEKQKKGWKKIDKQDFLIPWKNPNGIVEVERYYHSFTSKELRDLLEQTGFIVEILEYQDRNKWSNGQKGQNLVAIAEKP